MIRLCIEIAALLYVAAASYNAGRKEGQRRAARAAMAIMACGDFHQDPDVPDHCEGCCLPKSLHTHEMGQKIGAQP